MSFLNGVLELIQTSPGASEVGPGKPPVTESLPQRDWAAETLTGPSQDSPPTGAWRLRVVRREVLPGPIRLNAWTCIVDPAKCAQSTLVDLGLAIVHKNAGRETAFTRLVEEYVQQLAACGVHVVIEAVS